MLAHIKTIDFIINSCKHLSSNVFCVSETHPWPHLGFIANLFINFVGNSRSRRSVAGKHLPDLSKEPFRAKLGAFTE